MKLLFDENLSPRLAQMLAREHPGSAHVRQVGLLGAADQAVWEYAKTHGFAIVSKDTDFRDRCRIEKSAPKVIWLSVGNAGTPTIAALLRREHARLTAYEREKPGSPLSLFA